MCVGLDQNRTTGTVTTNLAAGVEKRGRTNSVLSRLSCLFSVTHTRSFKDGEEQRKKRASGEFVVCVLATSATVLRIRRTYV